MLVKSRTLLSAKASHRFSSPGVGNAKTVNETEELNNFNNIALDDNNDRVIGNEQGAALTDRMMNESAREQIVNHLVDKFLSTHTGNDKTSGDETIEEEKQKLMKKIKERNKQKSILNKQPHALLENSQKRISSAPSRKMATVQEMKMFRENGIVYSNPEPTAINDLKEDVEGSRINSRLSMVSHSNRPPIGSAVAPTAQEMALSGSHVPAFRRKITSTV